MKYPRHTINVNDLEKWEAEKMILFASSSHEGKRLFRHLNGNYEVVHNGKPVLSTRDKKAAIQKYNEI